jgi:hypothetical protein
MTWLALTLLLMQSPEGPSSGPRTLYLWSEAGIVLPRIEGYLYGTLDTGLDAGRMLIVSPFQENAPNYLFAVLERADFKDDQERDEFVNGFLGGYFREHTDMSTTPQGSRTLGDHQVRLYSVQAKHQGNPAAARVAVTFGEGRVVALLELGDIEAKVKVSQTMEQLLSGMYFIDTEDPVAVKRLPVLLYLLGAFLMAAALAYLAYRVILRKIS